MHKDRKIVKYACFFMQICYNINKGIHNYTCRYWIWFTIKRGDFYEENYNDQQRVWKWRSRHWNGSSKASGYSMVSTALFLLYYSEHRHHLTVIIMQRTHRIRFSRFSVESLQSLHRKVHVLSLEDVRITF